MATNLSNADTSRLTDQLRRLNTALSDYRARRYTTSPSVAPPTSNVATTEPTLSAVASPPPVISPYTINPALATKRKEAGYYEGRLTTALGETPEARAERIKEETRQQMQARVDAINTFYVGETARAREFGRRGEERARAINLNAGLGGSPFASAAAAEAESKTSELVAAKEAEKNLRIQEVYGIIDANADERIRAEEARIIGDMEKYDSIRKDLYSSSLQAIKSLGISGTDWNSFKTLNPEEATQLLEDAGLSDEEAKLTAMASTPQDEVDYQWGQSKVVGGKLLVPKVVTDAKTKKTKISWESVGVPEGLGGKELDKIEKVGDQLYRFYKDNSYDVIGERGGFNLSAGQSRYDSSGKLIARAPTKEESSGFVGDGAIPTEEGGGSADLDVPSSFESLEDIKKAPVSELTKAVMAGFTKAKDLTPTNKAKVAEELFKVGFNPNQYILRKLNSLAQLYRSVPENFRGIVQGRIPLYGQYDPTNNSSAFDSARTVLTREVARLNDVGVLSDQDVASYNQAMPSRSDKDIGVVDAKIRGLGSSFGPIKDTDELNTASDETLMNTLRQEFPDLTDEEIISLINE